MKKQSTSENLWTRVSHDLRQPIQSLLLLSHVVAMTDDRAGRQTAARSMEDSLLALQSMIENLAAVAKLEAGTIRAAPASTALGPLLQAMAATATGVVNDPHRKVETRFEPITMTTDRLMLGTLMNWIAINVAHMARSGVIELRCRRIGTVAHLDCHYTGKAPSLTQLNAIFVEAKFVEAKFVEAKTSGSAMPSSAILPARIVPGLGFLATYAKHIAAELEHTTQMLDRQIISLKINELDQASHPMLATRPRSAVIDRPKGKKPSHGT